DTTTVDLTVRPAVVAAMSIDQRTACTELNTLLRDRSGNASGADRRKWTLRPGGQELVYRPTTDTMRVVLRNDGDTLMRVPVELVVWNRTDPTLACADTIRDTLDIYPTPRARFTYAAPGCSPADVRFTYEDVALANGERYEWDFGDGRGFSRTDTSDATFSGTFVHRFEHFDDTTVRYPVRLRVTNRWGCVNEYEQVIEVQPTLQAELIATDPGCQPYAVQFGFRNLSGGARFFTWDFGDGTGLPNSGEAAPLKRYNQPGTYYVTVTVSHLADLNLDACELVLRDTVVVHPKPVFSVAVTPNDACSGTALEFYYPERDHVASVRWVFPNDTLSEAGQEEWTTTGFAPFERTFYNLSTTAIQDTAWAYATSDQGCLDTSFVVLRVRPQVVAGFALDNREACGALELEARDTSGLSATNIIWTVTYPDGLTQIFPQQRQLNLSLQNLTDTVQVTYLHLYAWNASDPDRQCASERLDSVVIKPVPRTRFTYDPLGCTTGDDEVRFTYIFRDDTTAGRETYYWNFGDGQTLIDTSETGAPVVHRYRNVTGGLVEYPVTLRIVNEAGCEVTRELVVPIRPEVVPSFAFVSDACAPYGVTFNNTSGDGARRFTWDFGDNSPTSSLEEPTHLYQNAGVYTVTLTAIYDNLSCPVVYEQQFEVHPVPVSLPNITPGLVCSGEPFTVRYNYDVGVPVPDSLIWYLPTGDDTVRVVRTDTNAFTWNIRHVGFTQQVYTARLVAKSAFGCTDEAEAQIVVKPELTARILLSDSAGCSPLTVTFTDTSDGAAARREWAFGYDFLNPRDGRGNQQRETRTFVNRSDTIMLVPVRMQTYAVDDPGLRCAPVAFDTILVYPTSRTRFTAQPPACSNGSDTYTFNYVYAGADLSSRERYTWRFGRTTFIDTSYTGTPVTHTFTNTSDGPIMVDVRLVINNDGVGWNCRVPLDTQIRVLPAPQAAFAEVTDACAPYPVQFVNTSRRANYFVWEIEGREPNTSTFEPFVNSFAPNVLFDQPGTYDVTLKAYYDDAESGEISCVDTYTQTLRVGEVPRPDIGPFASAGCAPLGITFTNATDPASVGNQMRYVWNWGDGNANDTTDRIENVQHVFENPTNELVTYNISLTAINVATGCAATMTRAVQVRPAVVADIALATPGDSAGCSPHRFQVNVLSPTPERFGLRYLWWSTSPDLADTTYASRLDGSLLFTNNTQSPVTHWIYYKVEQRGQCSAVDSVAVTVYPNPLPRFNVSVDGTCSPVTVTFDRRDATQADSVFWLISDGARVDTIADRQGNGRAVWDSVFVNDGFVPLRYDVQLLVRSRFGCEALSSASRFIVNPAIQAAFTAPEAGCSPFTFTPSNTSINPGGTYQWDLPGSDLFFSDEEEPTVTYTYNGTGDTTFVLTMIARSGFDSRFCSDTLRDTITVYGTPAPNFSVTSPIQLPNSTVTIQNLTPERELWEYVWLIGGDTIRNDAREFDYTFEGLDTNLTDSLFNVTLIASGPAPRFCSEVVTRPVIIRPATPIAAFEADTAGCQPVTVTFRNGSRYGHTYIWSFGDGTVIQTSSVADVQHTYFTPGVYSVRLRVLGLGGEDMMYREDIIEVYQQPRVSFSTFPDPPEVRIPTEPLNFITFIEFEDPSAQYTYLWDFGDGSQSFERNPEHRYTEEGEYVVSLTVTNKWGCSATYVDSSGARAVVGGDVVIPNAFSPSNAGPSNETVDLLQGDRNNDIFYPKVLGAREIALQIYSRWGELIFESIELGRGWDGYYKGVLVKQDVYVYRVEVKFMDGRRETFVGDVTLVR
ncbi:MAG: PKD domain-containing protein, partial [Catalinimonas sp.]